MAQFVLYALFAACITALLSSVDAQASNPYAPIHISCPSIDYVRPATAISAQEKQYQLHRAQKAAAALQNWLKKVGLDVPATDLPAVALATSGGGYRSFLTGAGVIQGLDHRDSNTSVSGLYQGLTYQTALSGGAWLLSSIAQSDYSTVSHLRDTLWIPGLNDSFLNATNVLTNQALTATLEADLAAKQAAGYPPTVVDLYGRLIAYAILSPPDGGVSDRLSGWSALSSILSNSVPFPIMTAIGISTFAGQCLPNTNSTQYEFSPYDFGSWDPSVNAFVPTRLLGTSFTDNKPTINSTCTINYDSISYIFGTSSDLFNAACAPSSSSAAALTTSLAALESFLKPLHNVTARDLFAQYPNPFYHSPFPAAASGISTTPTLSLVDGGELENDPLHPLLQPARSNAVESIIVNDNSADTPTNFPNGTGLYTTYLLSLSKKLTRMPTIPPPSTILSLTTSNNTSSPAQPIFFGCTDPSKVTIIYIPNTAYTFPSNQSTLKVQYTPEETTGMIANGVQVITKGGDPEWGFCLGCGILSKYKGGRERRRSSWARRCGECLSRYCYN